MLSISMHSFSKNRTSLARLSPRCLFSSSGDHKQIKSDHEHCVNLVKLRDREGYCKLDRLMHSPTPLSYTLVLSMWTTYAEQREETIFCSSRFQRRACFHQGWTRTPKNSTLRRDWCLPCSKNAVPVVERSAPWALSRRRFFGRYERSKSGGIHT